MNKIVKFGMRVWVAVVLTVTRRMDEMEEYMDEIEKLDRARYWTKYEKRNGLL